MIRGRRDHRGWACSRLQHHRDLLNRRRHRSLLGRRRWGGGGGQRGVPVGFMRFRARRAKGCGDHHDHHRQEAREGPERLHPNERTTAVASGKQAVRPAAPAMVAELEEAVVARRRRYPLCPPLSGVEDSSAAVSMAVILSP